MYAATGSSLSIAAGRLSYTLGLHGPCVSYYTACSAALAACHAGLRSMQLRECSSGLVLGVTLMLTPIIGTRFAVAGMTSAHGRSHTLDNRANGYARGEACGALALQNTHSALATGCNTQTRLPVAVRCCKARHPGGNDRELACFSKLRIGVELSVTVYSVGALDTLCRLTLSCNRVCPSVSILTYRGPFILPSFGPLVGLSNVSPRRSALAFFCTPHHGMES